MGIRFGEAVSEGLPLIERTVDVATCLGPFDDARACPAFALGRFFAARLKELLGRSPYLFIHSFVVAGGTG
jgi:hypothetical protein